MPARVLDNGVQITWYGHATTLITTPRGKRIMIDPFVRSNPACPKELHVVENLDLLLITHGHADHCADALEVPGVLWCNRPFRAASPSLVDIAPSILAAFGRETPPSMTGRSIFS